MKSLRKKCLRKVSKYMDSKILLRINTLLKIIEEVVSDLENVSFTDFEKSSLLQRATSFSISQVGETMTKIEASLGEKYKELPWKDARRMRNYIVHDYADVDIEEVFNTAKYDLPPLKEAFEKIKAELMN